MSTSKKECMIFNIPLEKSYDDIVNAVKDKSHIMIVLKFEDQYDYDASCKYPSFNSFVNDCIIIIQRFIEYSEQIIDKQKIELYTILNGKLSENLLDFIHINQVKDYIKTNSKNRYSLKCL
ncbi:MAG: hypothetical protein ACOCP8_05480 [archaeon]